LDGYRPRNITKRWESLVFKKWEADRERVNLLAILHILRVEDIATRIQGSSKYQRIVNLIAVTVSDTNRSFVYFNRQWQGRLTKDAGRIENFSDLSP
jgi:hypothetical protein